MTQPPQTGPESPPPRAFTQGVGTVFQVGGVTMFLLLMTLCCGSSLLGKEGGERPDLAGLGWHIGSVFYSVPRAMSVSLVVGLALAIGVASLGLGMQALHQSAAFAAAAVAPLGAIFWAVHLLFAITAARSILLAALALLLFLLYIVLSAFALAAAREMIWNPPPRDHEVLPPGYKIPYSWYHDDPPEVRLARELEERRRKLEVQKKELEMLEERIRKGSSGGQ